MLDEGLLAKHPKIEQFLSQYLDAPRWFVAVSGGADSIALLAFVRAVCDAHEAPPVTAVYINHGLHSDASQWGSMVERVSRAFQFGFLSDTVCVVESGRGLEEAARSARYRAFEQVLSDQDVLMTAHHLDDQFETFLMRAFRGAGPEGLRAMLPERTLGKGRLIRPLLSTPKSLLIAVAEAVAPDYVQDPSNEDGRYDRGFLRQELIPLIRSRWPQASASVGRSADLLQAYWDLHADTTVSTRWAVTGEPLLEMSAASTADARAEMVRRWLAALNLYRPPRVQLEEFIRQISGAREDKGPLLQTGQYVLRWYAGAIYCCSIEVTALNVGDVARVDAGLTAVSALGRFVVNVSDSVRSRVEVRSLGAGESCRMHPNQPRRKLTKLLHQWRIPPWWRGAVPVTCVDGLVVGVLNRVVDPALLAQIDPELADLEIVWEHQLIEKSGFVYREVSQ